MIPLNPARKVFYSLESLRGIAAVLVLLFHMPWIIPAIDNPFVRNGYLMVDLFFVLSGFVIYHSYRDKISSLGDFKKFIGLRLGRIYPLHLVMLLVTLFIAILKYTASTRFHMALRDDAFPPHPVISFIANLFLIEGQKTEHFIPWNLASWSISVELLLYIVFGALSVFAAVFARKINQLIFPIIACAAMYFLGQQDQTAPEYLVDIARGFSGFFLGICVYEVYQLLQPIMLPSQTTLSLNVNICASIFILIMMLCLRGEAKTYDFYIYILFGMLVLALALLPQGAGINQIMTVRPLLWLGKVSYSIYLIHAAIEWFFTQVMRTVLKVPTITYHDRIMLTPPTPTGMIFLCLDIAAVFICAHFTYIYIEDYFRKKSRKVMGIDG